MILCAMQVYNHSPTEKIVESLSVLYYDFHEKCYEEVHFLVLPFKAKTRLPRQHLWTLSRLESIEWTEPYEIHSSKTPSIQCGNLRPKKVILPLTVQFRLRIWGMQPLLLSTTHFKFLCLFFVLRYVNKQMVTQSLTTYLISRVD